jgi:ribosomal protein L29
LKAFKLKGLKKNMGLFSKKSQSLPIDELTDAQALAALKKGKAPTLSAKELRKMSKEELRKTVGERGLGALKAAADQQRVDRERRIRNLEQSIQSGSDPHAIAKMKAQDPKGYQQLVHREAKRQGLI